MWIAENIRADKDAQGNAIDETKIYNPNNEESNVAIYGKLYNMEGAQNVCPEGWRLPTKEEAQTLVNSMGETDIAGVKLAGDQNLWKGFSENKKHKKSVTENYGKGLFNAVPAGYFYNSEYYGFQNNTSFWCSTLDDSEDSKDLSDSEKKVYAVTLSYNDDKDVIDAIVGAIDRNFALSVRCVKEQ